jgi:hypothetical protein
MTSAMAQLMLSVVCGCGCGVGIIDAMPVQGFAAGPQNWPVIMPPARQNRHRQHRHLWTTAHLLHPAQESGDSK